MYDPRRLPNRTPESRHVKRGSYTTSHSTNQLKKKTIMIEIPYFILPAIVAINALCLLYGFFRACLSGEVKLAFWGTCFGYYMQAIMVLLAAALVAMLLNQRASASGWQLKVIDSDVIEYRTTHANTPYAITVWAVYETSIEMRSTDGAFTQSTPAGDTILTIGCWDDTAWSWGVDTPLLGAWDVYNITRDRESGIVIVMLLPKTNKHTATVSPL